MTRTGTRGGGWGAHPGPARAIANELPPGDALCALSKALLSTLSILFLFCFIKILQFFHFHVSQHRGLRSHVFKTGTRRNKSKMQRNDIPRFLQPPGVGSHGATRGTLGGGVVWGPEARKEVKVIFTVTRTRRLCFQTTSVCADGAETRRHGVVVLGGPLAGSVGTRPASAFLPPPCPGPPTPG